MSNNTPILPFRAKLTEPRFFGSWNEPDSNFSKVCQRVSPGPTKELAAHAEMRREPVHNPIPNAAPPQLKNDVTLHPGGPASTSRNITNQIPQKGLQSKARRALPKEELSPVKQPTTPFVNNNFFILNGLPDNSPSTTIRPEWTQPPRHETTVAPQLLSEPIRSGHQQLRTNQSSPSLEAGGGQNIGKGKSFKTRPQLRRQRKADTKARIEANKTAIKERNELLGEVQRVRKQNEEILAMLGRQNTPINTSGDVDADFTQDRRIHPPATHEPQDRISPSRANGTMLKLAENSRGPPPRYMFSEPPFARRPPSQDEYYHKRAPRHAHFSPPRREHQQPRHDPTKHELQHNPSRDIWRGQDTHRQHRTKFPELTFASTTDDYAHKRPRSWRQTPPPSTNHHHDAARLMTQHTPEPQRQVTERPGEPAQKLPSHDATADGAPHVAAFIAPDAGYNHDRDNHGQPRDGGHISNPPRAVTPPTPIIEPFETRWARVPKIDGSVKDLYNQWGKHSKENERLMLELLIPAWRDRPFEQWDLAHEAHKIELQTCKPELEATSPTSTLHLLGSRLEDDFVTEHPPHAFPPGPNTQQDVTKVQKSQRLSISASRAAKSSQHKEESTERNTSPSPIQQARATPEELRRTAAPTVRKSLTWPSEANKGTTCDTRTTKTLVEAHPTTAENSPTDSNSQADSNCIATLLSLHTHVDRENTIEMAVTAQWENFASNQQYSPPEDIPAPLASPTYPKQSQDTTLVQIQQTLKTSNIPDNTVGYTQNVNFA